MGYSPSIADVSWVVQAIVHGPDPIGVCDWVLDHGQDDDIKGIADLLKGLYQSPSGGGTELGRLVAAVQELQASIPTGRLDALRTEANGAQLEVHLVQGVGV